MVQKIPLEEQIRQEQEIIGRTQAVIDRLEKERARIEATLRPDEIDYEIQMATVRLGVNAAKRHIHAHEMSLQTLMARAKALGNKEGFS